MHKIVLIMALLFVPFLLAAQEYKHSAGLRLGVTSAITYKSFLNDKEAVELLLSGRREGIQLTTLYTFHKPMEFAFNENFFLYYGVGAHVGYEEYDRFDKVLVSVEPPRLQFEQKTYFVMGADALLGIEYRWLSVPATISFDIKPYFTFIGMRYIDGRFWDAAITFKYIF